MRQLQSVLRIPMTRDIIINTLGNYLNVGFTIIYTLLLLRVFDRSEYGVFSVLVALASVSANILDFGVTASIFSELPTLYEKREQALIFLKTNLIFQTILSFFALIIIFLFIKPIDELILKLHAPFSAYIITLCAVPLLIWQNSLLNAMYATKKFLSANIYINISNLVKIAVLFWFIFKNSATVTNILFSLFIVGPIAFVILVILSKPHLLKQLLASRLSRGSIKLRFSATYFGATQLFNLGNRLDIFMLAFFLPTSSVGLYAPAQKIILTILTAVNSITQVLSPQFAADKTRKQVIATVRRGFFFILVPIGLFIGVILTPFSIYELFFTSEFAPTANIARTLALAYVPFALCSVPLLFFLYTIRKPIYLLITNLLFLVIVFLGCYVFIPRFGLLGPPIAFGLAFVSISIYITWAFAKEFRKLP